MPALAELSIPLFELSTILQWIKDYVSLKKYEYEDVKIEFRKFFDETSISIIYKNHLDSGIFEKKLNSEFYFRAYNPYTNRLSYEACIVKNKSVILSPTTIINSEDYIFSVVKN